MCPLDLKAQVQPTGRLQLALTCVTWGCGFAVCTQEHQTNVLDYVMEGITCVLANYIQSLFKDKNGLLPACGDRL